jgi:DNA-binding NtrC family response regulator
MTDNGKILHRTLVLMDDDRILHFYLQSSEQSRGRGEQIKGPLLEVKKQLLCDYLSCRLEELGGDRKLLADELSIHVNNLYRMLRECNL